MSEVGSEWGSGDKRMTRCFKIIIIKSETCGKITFFRDVTMSPVQPQAIKCKSNLLFKLFHFIFVNFVTADTHRGMNGWTFWALIEATRQAGALNRKNGSFEARIPAEGQRWTKLWCISEWVFPTLTSIEAIFCEASWIAQPFLPLCMNWPNDDILLSSDHICKQRCTRMI